MATVTDKTPHTILVVDDEPEIRRALSRVLSGKGYRVIAAASAANALAIMKTEHIDVLLSDIDMPGMTGIELATEVRRLYPEVVRIILTGGASLETALRAINDGEVHRYLTKPWQQDELLDNIRKAIERLDELRRVQAVENAARRRAKLREELEQEQPEITQVGLHKGTYVISAERLADLRARFAKTDVAALVAEATDIATPQA